MEDLFRFAQIRRARAADGSRAVLLDAPTALQGQLASAAVSADPAAALKAHAEAFAATTAFLADPGQDPVVAALHAAAEAVAGFADPDTPFDAAALGTAIDHALGRPLATFLAASETAARIAGLKDTVIAVKLLRAEHHRPIAVMVQVLRVHEFLTRYAADPDTAAASAADLRAALRRNVELPAWIDAAHPADRTGSDDREAPDRVGEIRDRLADIADRHEALDAAITELTAVPPTGFRRTPQHELPERMPPADLRPEALFRNELAIRKQSLTSTLFAAGVGASDGGGNGHATPPPEEPAAAARWLGLDVLTPTAPILHASTGAAIALGGRPGFTPAAGPSGPRLAAETADALSRGTKKALAGLALDPGAPVPALLEGLREARATAHREAQELVRPLFRDTAFRRRGDTVIAGPGNGLTDYCRRSPRSLLGLLDDTRRGQPGAVPDPAPHPAPPPVPHTHADLRPAGVMDLLIVRQALQGYEAGEIAYIDNVLKSEVRDRVHRTRTETETLLLRETERTTEHETSLETTERFEIRRESQQLLQERSDVKGALSVSGSYGPTVDFESSGEASWSRATEQGARAACTMARDVTERASERTAERILERQSRRTTTEVEETDRHTFDNKTGSEHVTGIYQWVTKRYRAQVYNYGRRTLYDLMLPEPGALLVASFRRAHADAVHLVEPPRFTVRPEDLTPDTYQDFVAMYGATGIKPPPPPYVTEAYDFNTGGEDEDQEFTNSTRVRVPDGYRAVQAAFGVTTTVWDDWAVDAVVGRRSHRFASGGTWVWETDLDGETDSVPLAMTTDKVGDIALAVEILCAATPHALALWQSEVHGQLVDAYRARQSEYESKLAGLEAEAPPEVVSRSAYRNRRQIVDELKRACVDLLSEQDFTLFDAVADGADGMPVTHYTEARAEGAYVRFFEQVFEWENMAWVCYPYFWGRRAHWFEHLDIRDDDPEFEDFLNAGYARVVLPVRPGFEAAVDHFRLFGEPWTGGPLPTVTDAAYLPVADELAERSDRPSGSEVPVGEPWEVSVPTTLVYLRRDAGLPRWAEDADGGWSPVDG